MGGNRLVTVKYYNIQYVTYAHIAKYNIIHIKQLHITYTIYFTKSLDSIQSIWQVTKDGLKLNDILLDCVLPSRYRCMRLHSINPFCVPQIANLRRMSVLLLLLFSCLS